MKPSPDLSPWLRWLTFCCAAIAVLAAGTSPARGYPISPQPLWKLVEGATVIVLAEVTAVEEPQVPEVSDEEAEALDDDEWEEPPPHRASLRVIEVWKGEAGGELIVPFEGFWICPAPPRYEQGKRVLAFLALDDAGELQTVGLSYGTLYPNDDARDDFRAMVKSAIRLQAEPPVSPVDRQAWSVEAAARRGTRWHGLYELDPEGDEVHSFYDRSAEPPPKRGALTAPQLQRLAASFVAAPSSDQTAVMMLQVLAGWRSEALDHAAVSVVEALLAEEEPAWWLRELLALVLVRYGDAQVEKRIQALGDRFADYSIDAARKLWEGARRELEIPEVEPARIDEPEVWGVGERTPS